MNMQLLDEEWGGGVLVPEISCRFPSGSQRVAERL